MAPSNANTLDGPLSLPPGETSGLPEGAGALLDASRVAFANMNVSPLVQEAALGHLTAWLSQPHFAIYRPQVQAMIEQERWVVLLDSFYQVMPFGTGGRRGGVGVGPNRFNPWTLGASVQGHATWMRKVYGDRPLSVVLACDVRTFSDLRGELTPGLPNPVRDLTSRDFANIAAEVYAAAEITVWLPSPGIAVSTPELGFAIRVLGADAGLQISASHNPPDDNGSKFYNSHGGQEVPPRDEQVAREVSAVGFIERMSLDRARAAGLVREYGTGTYEAYLKANLACGRDRTARAARVAFSNLHGTGERTVARVLTDAGFDLFVEPTQSEPDGAFPTVPFRLPNPEVPEVFEVVTAFAERVGADLAFACDPDADRLGMVVRERLHGADPAWEASTAPARRWRFLTGNEIAALVCHYAVSNAPTPRPLVIRTEVTSRLVSSVARARGAVVIDHLLVGFKYIGAVLQDLEEHGEHAGVRASLADFVLGAEESHGVLVTSALRDKDAAGGALLLAELASQEKLRGRTLVDTLRDLWTELGYVGNELASTAMRGAEGRARIVAIQQSLRQHPPTTIGNRTITAVYDRQDPEGIFGAIVSQTDRASRDVLVFELGPDARVVLRPSGTEPKTKVYAEVRGRPGADLATEIPRVNAECRALVDEFGVAMLSRVGITLPGWARRISNLVPVEQKLHFAERVLPALVARLTVDPDDEQVGEWLDRELRGYGRDARRLVSDGVHAWLASHPTPLAGSIRALFPQR